MIADEDNFWDIGQGPSGPDTEIFYDRGQEFNNLADDDPENYPGGENERYLEIWNIVFSQFNHTPEDTYEPLPHKNIDTGMGLERVVSIFENGNNPFKSHPRINVLMRKRFIGIFWRVVELTENNIPNLQVAFIFTARVVFWVIIC